MPQQPLTPSLIAEFKSGINTYLQPWIRPIDAFNPLVNAYIYRGVVNKRSGYTQFGATLPDGNPVMGIMRYIDETTGAISLIVASTVNLYSYNVGTGLYVLIAGGFTFTGNIKNFFNSTNWQAATGLPSYLWIVNGIDPVTRITTQVGPPPFIASRPTLTVSPGVTITAALDVLVYKQRLLLLRPTLSVGGVQNQSIYWSQQQNPDSTDSWRTDIAGHGGNEDAPTGDIIQSAEFIRDVLVVFFTNSTWVFRFTGNDTSPFRWDKVNNTKSTNAPYGSVAYDERCTSIGGTGLIACDGVNVQRYDVPIIDYYETNFSQQYFSQSFSQRYENLNQSWTLYVGNERNPDLFPIVGGAAPGSNKALIYNFLENTWATYEWKRPLTCLGLFLNPTSDTWEQTTEAWENTDEEWNTYSNQAFALILLAGDTTGHVWRMDDRKAIVDEQIDTAGEIIAVGTGVTTYTGTLAHIPLVPGSLTITDGTEHFLSNSNGILIGDLGGTGTIVYNTGVFSVTFNSAVPALTNITANYISGISIVPDIVTTRWNPVMKAGQKVQFAYIDIYYYIASLDALNPISVTLNFFVDNSNKAATSRTLTLDGPINSTYTFKRIYVNLVGEFLQMEIDPNVDSFMQFLGFILWTSPAGRLTPP